jgi:tight adherence protein B
MTETTRFIILLAVAVGAIGWGITRLVVMVLQWERRRLQRRLSETGWERAVREAEDMPSIRKTPGDLSGPARWRNLLSQASPDLTLERFVGLVAMLTVVAGVGVYAVSRSPLAALAAAAVGAAVPFLRILHQRRRRQQLIVDQLVEALEFLARVLRAGHSLSTGIQMIGEELPDPIASEFRRCYDQHALGQSLEEAMTEMALRVESRHFSFFVTSVLIQRQTGGNLSEILDNICGVVRARIRLQQHVRAITAEGRLTGYILSAFPVVIFLAISALNNEYAGVLLRTQAGQIALVIGVIMQILALITIRRIVTVKA